MFNSLSRNLLLFLFVRYSVQQVTDDSQVNDSVTNSTTSLFSNFLNCFNHNEIVDCLQDRTYETIDLAIGDNETWYLSDYVTLEKNADYQPVESRESVATSLWTKLQDLVESRQAHFFLNPYSSVEEGKRKKGRRKKNKHGAGGGVFMASGLAMAAMVAQVVLGKVALVAAVALILSKIALYVATQKSVGTTAPATHSTTDHVVYADHEHIGSGIGGSSNWQRSIYPSGASHQAEYNRIYGQDMQEYEEHQEYEDHLYNPNIRREKSNL